MTDSDTGTAEIAFAPHSFNGLSAECETMDLFTGFDMLFRHLDEIGSNITNETNDLDPSRSVYKTTPNESSAGLERRRTRTGKS